MWQKIGFDIIRISICQRKNYIVMTRDDFLGWVEERAFGTANLTNIIKFI